MLGQYGDHHGRVFGALGFVDGDGVGQGNLIQVGVQDAYTIKTLRQCRVYAIQGRRLRGVIFSC